MKAIVIHGALDLRIEEREPSMPGPDEVSIAIRRGGICGSDLHYYQHGGFGTIRLKEPMILGHEIAGEIAAVGAKVTTLKVGDKVAVNPSRPCRVCVYCQRGLQNHCLDMLFYGSAMRMPHVQGAFRQSLVALESQCHKIASGVSLEEAAFAEPFAVTLHAIARAGALTNKRVLVTGCGPSGPWPLSPRGSMGRGRSRPPMFPTIRWRWRGGLALTAPSMLQPRPRTWRR